jgi:arsenate reductase
MLTIFGIKSCDTCRRARKYLTEHNIEFQFHDLREDGLNIQMLERWTQRIGWARLLNKQSLTWRKIPEVDRNDMTHDKALAAMIDNPTLVKRPVLEGDKFIAVGFSEKRFGDFINNNEI